MGFSDHKATATVWYRLLNLGFRLPTGAGTDAMANYASLRGPVGLNRVFLDTGGKLDAASAMRALKAGHGFASNGPLLGLLLDGARPGAQLAPGRHHYRIALRSPVAVDHLELVHNGEVVKAFTLERRPPRFDAAGEIELDGGWVLLRAWNDGADPQVLDLYPYATTNPVWLGDHVLAPSARARRRVVRALDRPHHRSRRRPRRLQHRRGENASPWTTSARRATPIAPSRTYRRAPPLPREAPDDATPPPAALPECPAARAGLGPRGRCALQRRRPQPPRRPQRAGPVAGRRLRRLHGRPPPTSNATSRSRTCGACATTAAGAPSSPTRRTATSRSRSGQPTAGCIAFLSDRKRDADAKR